MLISSWRKNCFRWRWLVGWVCFNCSVTAETWVANQIQIFGHDNYSKQMCLFMPLKNVYLQFIILFLCVSFHPSKVSMKKSEWSEYINIAGYVQKCSSTKKIEKRTEGAICTLRYITLPPPLELYLEINCQ